MRCRTVASDPSVHANEHSIEVELPIILAAFGAVRILPIMVRPGDWAPEIGRVVAKAAADLGRRVTVLASTDLTHYGPAFGFEPAGHGRVGVQWAKTVNDRRFIRRTAELDADAVVPEAAVHHNACGAGAVAAAIAAAVALGAERYVELEHCTSAEREREPGYEPENSVGYESGVFVGG